jgi:hypothetical protein
MKDRGFSGVEVKGLKTSFKVGRVMQRGVALINGQNRVFYPLYHTLTSKMALYYVFPEPTARIEGVHRITW